MVKAITVMEFTPDGTELLVGRRDGMIKVVDPLTGHYKRLVEDLKVSY